MGLWRNGTMQGDAVRLSLDLPGLGVTAADPFEFGRAVNVKADHAAAKSGHDPGKEGADLASADHRHATTDQIETHEAIELEIAIARAIVGARNLAIERKEQANSKLGDGVGRIIGDPHDLDAKFLRRSYVDVVKAGGACCNKLRATGGETLQHVTVDHIVYEDADSRKPGRQRRRGGPEERIEIHELVSVTRVQLLEQHTLVVLRPEY